jgi:hypothetical protein
MIQTVMSWLIVVIVLVPVELLGQEWGDSVASPLQRALQELESVNAEANSLTDKLTVVKVRARAANLLWLHDPNRARMMFREVWKWVEEQEDKSFDREAARTEILKNVFPRDPNMAGELLEKVLGEHKSEGVPFQAQIAGTDLNLKRLVKLSSELVEQDTATAALLLERSLSTSVSPAALFVLFRLREKDPGLADYVVTRTLENLRMRPTVVALPGVYVLLDYVFPSRQRFGGAIKPPDASLRMQYFSTAYDILQRSLGESEFLLQREKGYTEKDLRFRLMYQGQVAAVLRVLAPRYAPELAEELNKLTVNLAAGLPPEISRLHQFTLARLGGNLGESDSLEMAVSVALARGELDKARRLLGKIEDESIKKVLSQTMAEVEFRVHLDKSHLVEAMMTARRIEDPNIRASLYAQIAKAAYQKGEVEFSRLILTEAHTALSESDSNGIRARALLSLAAEAPAVSVPISVELLWSAVSLINSLTVAPGAEAEGNPLAKVNDPRSLIDAPELQRAFSSVGSVDFDSALLAAGQVKDGAIRLIARLSACQRWLTEGHER